MEGHPKRRLVEQGPGYWLTSLVQLSDYLGTLAGGPDSSPLGHGP